MSLTIPSKLKKLRQSERYFEKHYSAPRGCTEDEGMAPRSRLTGAGFKAPQAAVVKSHGGER